MSYQLTSFGVLRLSDSAFIPQEPSNRDWVEYQEWLVSGGQVLPLDLPPESTTANQGMLGLFKRMIQVAPDSTLKTEVNNG
ncbi:MULTISPECIES: hypothetical protein [unclassified Pseudomonas]|uniref:hypothetical protein n=1 Tax=unclassified Pseudomonas TaxID=196821 RepID=UPI000A1FB2AE|nr:MULTISPECIES: hypothetical protein [unclassified Pseudomonas]